MVDDPGGSEMEAIALMAALAARFGRANPAQLVEGMLVGTPQQIIDRLGRYHDAGVTWLSAV